MGSVDLSLGPMLIGTMMSILLFGIMIIQTYIYFERHKNDKAWIKAMVVFLLILDALSSSFAMSMTYNYLITNFGKLEAIVITNTGTNTYPIFTGVTACVVQCFFARRIGILTQNRPLASIVVVLSLTQMLASIGVGIGGVIVKEFSELVKLKQIILIWLLASVVTDAIITISLVWFLHHAKTGHSSTDHMTGRIIRFTVQTGLLTTTCALTVVIAYLVSSQSTVDLAFGLPLSKLYTNSLVSSLNARKAWGQEETSESNRPRTESCMRNIAFQTSTTITSDFHGTISTQGSCEPSTEEGTNQPPF